MHCYNIVGPHQRQLSYAIRFNSLLPLIKNLHDSLFNLNKLLQRKCVTRRSLIAVSFIDSLLLTLPIINSLLLKIPCATKNVLWYSYIYFVVTDLAAKICHRSKVSR